MITIEKEIEGKKIIKYKFGFFHENKKESRKINQIERIISNLFAITQNEERLINFLKNKETFKFKPEYKKLNLIQLGDYLFSLSSLRGYKTKENKIINSYNYEKIHISEARELAVKNLSVAVLDKNLTLGDKKIIKDIALKTLDANLKRSQDPKIEEIKNYTGCVRTDLSEWARDQLISYGFEYKHPLIKDLKLRK